MTPAASGGMSGGQMAGMGAIAMLGGGLLDYHGQTVGAKAVEREAKRQAAEQEAMSRAKQAAYIEALARADPSQGGAVAGQQIGIRMRAAAPALAAGGKALGLNGGQIGAVGRSILPAQIVGGRGASRSTMAQRTGENLAKLSNEQADIDSALVSSAALYGARNELAGTAGAGYRTGGQMIGSVGMPLMVAGMNRMAAPTPAADVRFGNGRAVPAGYTETTWGSGGEGVSGYEQTTGRQLNGAPMPSSEAQGRALYNVNLRRRMSDARSAFIPSQYPG